MAATEAFLQARDFLLTHRVDYAAACAGFEWPRPDTFNWACDWFDAVLAQGDFGDAPALHIVGSGNATVTFAEMSRASNRAANLLTRLGLRRGDRFLLMLGNVAPLWELLLAAMKLGVVVVPASTLLTTEDLRDRLRRGRVAGVACGPESVAKFDALTEKPLRIVVDGTAPGWIAYAEAAREAGAFTAGTTRADDPMLLYFTSGTTAQPKLVVHSHTSYPIGHLSTMYWLGLQTGDRHLNISSPGWAKHAWSCVFAPWNAGATVCVVNQPRFDARTLLDAVVAAEVTTMCAPPTVWRMLIQQPLREWQTHLRELCSAGEPLNPEVIETVQDAWGMTIRDGYGQTETTAMIGNPPGQRLQIGSMGRPLPGYRIELAHERGREGQEGEIALKLDPRPAALMTGYLDDDGIIRPEHGDIYRTGDVAIRDDAGYITYIGRADDVFKASDYRISPFELESALIEHALVAEAAVVPAPDAVRLAVPKAYLTLVDGAAPTAATAASIFAFLRTRLAPYKRVRRLEFAVLPKTISGKIRRIELRQSEAARAARGERGADEFRDEDFVEAVEPRPA